MGWMGRARGMFTVYGRRAIFDKVGSGVEAGVCLRWGRMSASAKNYRIALGSLAVVLLVYLLFGPKPWIAGVASVAEGGKSVKPYHHGVTGLWYAAAVNLGIVAVLLGIGRWLMLPLNESFVAKATGVGKRSRLVFVLAALVAVILGAYFSVPRLNSSLWGDEETMMKRNVVGEYLRSEGGLGEKLKFREAEWSDAFFRYQTPNNHVLASVMGKASHQMFFRKSDDPQANYFSEVVLRAPGLIASLLGIVATGWCLACLGFRRAGILAMFLLALHPWFVRYGSDFRGYPFMFLFMPLSLGFLIRGLRTGRWADFLIFGGCQFLMFYAYFGTIYVMIAMNLSAVLSILTGKGDWAARRVLLGRWFVACCGSGMAAIQFVGPLVPQIREYFSVPRRVEDSVTMDWTVDNLSNLAAGIPWLPWAADNPLCEYSSGYGPVATLLLFGVLLLALILGIVRMIRSSRQSAIFVIALLLPWIQFVIQATGGVGVLYQWYTLFAFPGLVMLVAVGIGYLPSFAGSLRLRNIGDFVVGLVFLTGFALYTSPARGHLRSLSAEPLKESVALTRSVVNLNHPGIEEVITVGYMMHSRGYDPYAYSLKEDDVEGFQELLQRARDEKKPLFVNLALRGLAAEQFPKITGIVEDSAVFVRVETLYGLDVPCTRFVYRLLP
jgi:hypothetical protein